MGERDKLSKVESRISLVSQISGGIGWFLSSIGVWPYALAAGVAVFAALYKVLNWIGQYGWAGWFLLAVASMVVVALVAATAFSALTRYEIYRRSRNHAAEQIAPSENIGPVFEAATGIGLLRSQFEVFEEDTRSALNSIRFKIDTYNKAVGEIRDSYSSLRMLRHADKAYKDLELAQDFMEKALSGDWNSWDRWFSSKETIEGYIRNYSHTMRKFIDADKEISAVTPHQFSPYWLSDRSISFPDDQTKHEFLTLYAYLHNARRTHIKLVTRLNSRIVSASAN